MILHSIPSAPRFIFAVILAFLRDVLRLMIFSTFSLGRECKRIERGLFVYFSCRFKRVKTVMQNFSFFFQENLTQNTGVSKVPNPFLGDRYLFQLHIAIVS